MKRLNEEFRKKLARVKTDFVRGIDKKINWNARIVGISGACGTGKTTLMLQHIKNNFGENLENVLYINLDNFYLSVHSLIDIVGKFSRQGGKFLFLDDVQKNMDFPKILKKISDNFLDMKIVFAGSSLKHMETDTISIYELQGLSFREYLSLKVNKKFPPFKLENILRQSEWISAEISSKIKPFAYFEDYLQFGYYPVFDDGIVDFQGNLENLLNTIMDVDLPLLCGVEAKNIEKMKQLLGTLAQNSPYSPKMKHLADEIDTSRITISQYLRHLEKTKFIKLLYETEGDENKKPEKIFAENTNLLYLFENKVDRNQTFLVNQLSYEHNVACKGKYFLINDRFTLGFDPKKDGTSGYYCIADDIEFGTDSQIPLWLFGFLY